MIGGARYFAGSYFPPTYWPKLGAVPFAGTLVRRWWHWRVGSRSGGWRGDNLE